MATFSKELYRKRLSLELAVMKTAPKRVGFNPAEDTPKLLQIPGDKEFVEAAYLTILGRDADDAGLAGYMDALRNKTSRREVIKRMAASDEAKAWSNLDNEEITESAGKLPMMQRLREGVVGKARHMLNQVLLSRFDAIDFRLAFLLNNIAERDQTLSKKIDDSIKALSEKLEARLASGPPEDGLMRLWKELVKPGMTVADVGANNGAFTVAAAAAGAKVHSFEPDPHINPPSGAAGGVIVHREAITDTEGSATLAVFPNQTARNTLYWPARGLNSVTVRTTTLDEALKAEPRVDLILLDVEGAEAYALRGMRHILAGGARVLLAFSPSNLHRAGVDPAAFLQELRQLGRPVSKVDPATGELQETSDFDLLSSLSAFLHLGNSK